MPERTNIGLPGNGVEQKVIRSVFMVGMLMLFFFALYAKFTLRSSWFYDCLVSIILLAGFLAYARKLRFSMTGSALVTLAVLSHNAGTFGFYSVSPLFIQYDHFTHSFGFLACAVALYDLISPDMRSSKAKLLFIVLVASLGIGSVIEMTEFTGYLVLGEGDGMFMLGAGDMGGDLGPVFASDVAKEWIDSMWDLMYNALGALAGIIFVSARSRWMLKR